MTETPEQMLREFHAAKAIHGGLMPDFPTAEYLRTAARTLRDRAGKATPGLWQHICLGSEGCLVLRRHGTIRERGRGRIARFGCKDWQADHADASYVTTMAPPVAEALADWLDAAAQAWGEGMEWPEALTVAGAVNGADLIVKEG